MKSIFWSALLGLLVCSSCQKEALTAVEDTFWLRHKGAEMPVWVRGNVASGQLVLYVHGGPGDCAMCYREYLQTIEKDVAVAYWDQRIAGSSMGKVDPNTLNYNQFGEDARYVIQLLHEQYPDVKIYLLAHSFGVELTWQFLTTDENQDLVAGVMLVNGTFSNYRWAERLVEWTQREATAQNRADILQFLADNPLSPLATITQDEVSAIYRKMLDLGGNPISLYDDKGYLLHYAFASPSLAFSQFQHGGAYEGFFAQESMRFDKSAALAGIRLPVGLFWGRKDGVVPVEIGHDTEALLTGTTVEWALFDNSWHEPFVTESEAFGRAVVGFVRGH